MKARKIFEKSDSEHITPLVKILRYQNVFPYYDVFIPVLWEVDPQEGNRHTKDLPEKMPVKDKEEKEKMSKEILQTTVQVWHL